MLQTVYVKPKEGGRVRQPERGSRVMPTEGALVPRNGYYTRLIMAGDVVISPEPEKPKAAPAQPAPEAAKPESLPVAEADAPAVLAPEAAKPESPATKPSPPPAPAARG